MKDNLFTALGIQNREDCVSNAIAFAINSSPSFCQEFLRQFCEKDANLYHSVKAYTRVSAGTSGIPDIVIALETGSEADLAIIENKLKAEDGSDQTVRYGTKEAETALGDRLVPGKAVNSASHIYLTLFPDKLPESSSFAAHRHSELVDIFERVSTWESEFSRQLIGDWCTLVKCFYEREHVAPSDIFHDKLTDESGLDAGYLYFQNALKQFRLPNALEIEYCFRTSRQGRRFYGAVISKDTWHPEEMKEVNGAWEINPQKCFNIHIEPQYNVLTGIFNLYLHYEINPYEPEQWVKDNIKESQYNRYIERRTLFISLLSSRNLPGWNFVGGSNQIAKVSLDSGKTTFAKIKTMIQNEIENISKSIDEVLDQL